jgi:glyoxylase-like metal-dependent hydrolase (beta-lactamase superfamily II)
MKVCFANSAIMPTLERLILKGGGLRKIPLRVRYGLILHPKFGPTLIDTGYTRETVTGERTIALRLYGRLFRPQLQPEGQPDAVLATHGLTPADITHVIITHFHTDHISGLRQFPNAKFIADGSEARSVLTKHTTDNARHGIFKELLPDDFAMRLIDLRQKQISATTAALPDGFDLFDDGSVLAVPFPGHMHSHFGIYFPQLRDPFLYATDVQWLHKAIFDRRLPGRPASIVTADLHQARRSADQVRAFAKAGGQVVLCHDPESTPWDIESAP